MEVRNLQRTSGGSYLLSIPKEWVEEIGLGKGSEVGLIRLGPETIMVNLRPIKESKPRSIELEMGENIGRRLTAAYLSGYDRVLIRSSEMITAEQKDSIRAASERLTGMEIINETSDRILLVNMVVPVDLSIQDVIRRMSQVGCSMLQDSALAVENGDPKLAQNVVDRDDALDRLYFLVIRLLRRTVDDLTVAERMGVTPAQCLDLRMAASMMEKIGDESVEACEAFLSAGGGRMELEGLLDLASEMCQLYRQATTALLKGDFSMSNMVTRSHPEIRQAISQMTASRPADEVTRLVVGCFESIADHIFDIADVVAER